MSIKTASSIALPQSISMTIRTNSPVNSSNLSRYLIFRNFANHEIKLKIRLDPTSTNASMLEITDFPSTTHNLQVLGSMNHRSYWDRIYLKNYGGSTAIDIHSISMTVHYVSGPSGAVRDIPLLTNKRVNQVLGQNTEIFLTPLIEDSVTDWAQLPSTAHMIALLAARDLGKSGTSAPGFDEHGDNPKYRGWLGYECSEFVSWYMHAAYQQTANYGGFPLDAFKDITYTQQIHDLFKDREKSYFYHNGRRAFLNEDNRQNYTPKAGDILIRRGGGRAEHSMILTEWNSNDGVATVIDGPYVVTLRTVKVHELEKRSTDPKDFIICAV